MLDSMSSPGEAMFYPSDESEVMRVESPLPVECGLCAEESLGTNHGWQCGTFKVIMHVSRTTNVYTPSSIRRIKSATYR